jgi:OOP family OmpA-OmpF porin
MNTTANYRNHGYLLDTAGNNAVVKSQGYDACVRTSDWTPARAIVECDPDLVPKPVAQAPIAPPAPKVQAPPVAPKIEAAPPKPAVQRFTLSADALFDFDKTTLTADGRKRLDDFADAVRGTRHDTITVTGHTDRAGTVAYNNRLSEQRAQTVKKYLDTKGLDVSKIVAVGKGKSETSVNPPACREPGLSRAQVYACLQPDRRVVIEVSGVKDANAPAAPAAARTTPTAPAARMTPPPRKAAPKPKPAVLRGM